MTNQTHPMSDTMSKSMTTTQCALAELFEPPLHIRVTVFIDGTGNNISNTEYRQAYPYQVPANDDDYVSYMADFSNVARLATTMNVPSADEDPGYHRVIYVEGMGTSRHETDDFSGMVRGTGGRGIWSRASDCFEDIVSYIRNVSWGRSKIDRLRVDCFGFSRGAATARHLVHLLVQEQDGLIDRVVRFKSLGEFEIPFVGLFDTVAHYDFNFTNDTEDLHLDAIKDQRVKRVVHLAAGDEHRYNFPLTNIASAGTKGRQYFLPGAHSDVGGSYNNIIKGDRAEYKLTVFKVLGTSDDPLSERCSAVERELVDLGWYQKEQITIQSEPGPLMGDIVYSVVVTRGGISNKYSYVPLHIMADKAGEKGLTFHLNEYDYKGEPQLTAIRSVIEDNSHDDQYWLYNKDPKIRDLRRFFLHFSSHYKPTSGFYPSEPQFHSTKFGFGTFYPNLMTGHRRRQIFNG